MKPFPGDWSRALAIVAHPDDVEYGAAAAIARWVREGKSIAYVMITSGEQGIEGMDPAVCGPIREKEQLASAARVGVTDVRFLRYPDFVLEDSPGLRADLVAVMREYRAELIVTLNFRDKWPGGDFMNSSDHCNAGSAIVAAAMESGVVRWVAACTSPVSTHGVDVSDFVQDAVASLQEHREYLRGLGPDDSSLQMLQENLTHGGVQLGTEAAVTFELIPIEGASR
ncbi:PIG-L family deacetylase [Hoyosella rhizosphaerae]|nr:PIG-L family deacetylase [Hoyosella rhizosphaerae]MBN4928311.1 PIG-L family deacetylase [Hoyosella rhizosphaerae]